jgi:hypothetical protein
MLFFVLRWLDPHSARWQRFTGHERIEHRIWPDHTIRILKQNNPIRIFKPDHPFRTRKQVDSIWTSFEPVDPLRTFKPDNPVRVFNPVKTETEEKCRHSASRRNPTSGWRFQWWLVFIGHCLIWLFKKQDCSTAFLVHDYLLELYDKDEVTIVNVVVFWQLLGRGYLRLLENQTRD